MAGLLALPNEILLEIINEICPGSLPSLALSCKLLLSLSSDCLTVHTERQKKYTTLIINKCSNHGERDSPLDLLRDVVDDWRIAFYPKNVFIGCEPCGILLTDGELISDEDGDDNQGSTEAERAEDIGVTKQLNSIIESFASAMIKRDQTRYPGVEPDEIRRSDLGEWNMILGLLLTKLRNIEFLTLEGYTGRGPGLLSVLWSLIEENLDPSYTGLSNFPKLRTFSVDGPHFDNADVGIMKGFALLPSVECLFGIGVRSTAYGEVDELLGACDSALEGNLKVREVDLRRTELSFESFSLFLRGMTHLKKFAFSFSIFEPSTDPYWLIDLLLCSKSSLEQLEFDRCRSRHLCLPDHVGYGSLRDFEVLKSVCVNVGLWIVNERRRKEHNLNEGCSEPGFVSPLVEVLPSCIETIQLNRDGFGFPIHMRDVDRLLDGLTGSKGKRLHSLKTIVFDNVERPSGFLEVLANAWIEKCAEIGVSLTLEWDPKVYVSVW